MNESPRASFAALPRAALLAFALLAPLALGSACGEADPVTGGACDPLLRDCTCDDGANGVQQCNPSGEGYGACVCQSDLGVDSGADMGSDADAGGDDLGADDATADAPSDLAADGDATLPQTCVDPTMDCVGEVSPPTCEDGVLATYRPTCTEDQRCSEEVVLTTCDFGCAPPGRGAACARLAYSTAADESGSLCVVTGRDDEMPQCFGAAGHHVVWNPEDASLLAFTAFGETAWAAVGDLDATDRLCELRPIGRTPPTYSAGSWVFGGGNSILVFEGDPDAGYGFGEWVYEPDGETCLAPNATGCTFVGGESFDGEAPFVIYGSLSASGERLIRVRENIAARTSLLISTDVGESCEQSELARIDDATLAGWQQGDTALYVANGNLFRLDVEDDVSTRLTNVQTDDWSRGEYVVGDFSWDGSIIVAESVDELDQDLYLFRLSDDGITPWPSAEDNVLSGPALRPSIERFQAE